MKQMKTHIKNYKTYTYDDNTYIFITHNACYILDTKTYQLTIIKRCNYE